MAQIRKDEGAYVLSLTKDELRLVGLGLAGLIDKDEDVAAARELNKLLWQERRRLAEAELRSVEQALKKAEEIALYGGAP